MTKEIQSKVMAGVERNSIQRKDIYTRLSSTAAPKKKHRSGKID